MTFIRLITNYNQLYRMKSISENPNPIDSISYRADTDEAIRICHRITFSTLIKFYIHWLCLLVLLLLRKREREREILYFYLLLLLLIGWNMIFDWKTCSCSYSMDSSFSSSVTFVLLLIQICRSKHTLLSVCVKLDCFRKFPSNCTKIARNIEPHTYFDAACFPKMYAVQNYQFQRYSGRSLGKKFNTRPHIDYSLI